MALSSLRERVAVGNKLVTADAFFSIVSACRDDFIFVDGGASAEVARDLAGDLSPCCIDNSVITQILFCFCGGYRFLAGSGVVLCFVVA